MGPPPAYRAGPLATRLGPLDVTCPQCAARPGVSCRTATSHPAIARSTPHTVRDCLPHAVRDHEAQGVPVGRWAPALGLSPRTLNAVMAANLTWEAQLRLMSDAELLRLPGLGRKGLAEIRGAVPYIHKGKGDA